jgi:hypothetical protein
MSFKAKKLNIDLTLDLTEYIPEEDGGILKTERIDAESINEWFDMAIEEGDKLQEFQKDKENISLVEMTKKGKKSVIKQIDFFYNKGTEFYKKIPMPVMNEILQYINAQLSPIKKK